MWVDREIAVPAEAAWELLVDVERWHEWGPSVRAAGLDGDRFETGATGWVETPLGLRVPFEITSVDEGRRWSWRVARIPATDHRVRPLGPAMCSVGFGVPTIAAPYAVVCRRALVTIDEILTG